MKAIANLECKERCSSYKYHYGKAYIVSWMHIQNGIDIVISLVPNDSKPLCACVYMYILCACMQECVFVFMCGQVYFDSCF